MDDDDGDFDVGELSWDSPDDMVHHQQQQPAAAVRDSVNVAITSKAKPAAAPSFATPFNFNAATAPVAAYEPNKRRNAAAAPAVVAAAAPTMRAVDIDVDDLFDGLF